MTYGKSEIFMRYKIEQLGLNPRTFNALKRKGITTVGEILLLTMGDLLDLRNVGAGSVSHLDDVLGKADLEAQVEELTAHVERLEKRQESLRQELGSLRYRVTGECA
jgi:DNA-directed RNA polymerase alpha subunit